MEIEILNPYKVKKRKFHCDSCEISYIKSEYKLLFDAKKIIYFKIPKVKKGKEIIICHECFYKYTVSLFSLKEYADRKYIPVIMIDKGKQYNCRIYPNKDISFFDEI